ncbi:MAG: flagellar hook-length control protein FliK [Sneathiella sp.]|nr:flagellar hook-length control protein FliK [Sneathiella sp.]
MDVGQIIGTTTTAPRRDPEHWENDNEGFSDYLAEPSPKKNPPAKSARTDSADSAARNTAPPEQPTQDTAESSLKPTEKSAEAEEVKNDETDETSADAITSPATPLVIVTLPTPSNSSVTPKAEGVVVNATANIANTALEKTVPTVADKSGTANGDSNTDTNGKTVTPEIAQKQSPANGMDGKPVSPVDQAASQLAIPVAAENTKNQKNAAQIAPSGTEKAVASPTPDSTGTTPPPINAFEKLQAEAAKLTDKDILSAKIAEMLQDGKGKISLTSKAPPQTFQSTLASTTNLVSAAMANNSSTPGIATSQLGVSGTENPGGQILPAAATNGQGISTDAMNQMLPGNHTATVQAVDATATNAASQATNAARMAAHLPVAEQVSTQISAAIKEGSDRIKISLHPSELGRVDVKLDVGHDGRVIAVVTVDKQETLDMLRQDARSLERALQDAGFQTGSNSLNFGLRQQGQDNASAFANVDIPVQDSANDSNPPTAPVSLVNPGYSGNGALDIQV